MRDNGHCLVEITAYMANEPSLGQEKFGIYNVKVNAAALL